MAIVLLQWRCCVLFFLFVAAFGFRCTRIVGTTPTPSTGSAGQSSLNGCISLLRLFHLANWCFPGSAWAVAPERLSHPSSHYGFDLDLLRRRFSGGGVSGGDLSCGVNPCSVFTFMSVSSASQMYPSFMCFSFQSGISSKAA